MRPFCNLVGWRSSIPTAVQLIKEMALALGLAIGAEGIAKITEAGLTLLGGAHWPLR
jgi:hypothetical protein